MNFDWSHYLKLAEASESQSRTHPPDEAKLRCAVSRAYYAAFCTARNYLRDRDGDNNIPKDAVHYYVKQQFLWSNDETRQEIGASLERMLKARKRADYDDTLPARFLDQVNYVLVEADEVLEKLRNLS